MGKTLGQKIKGERKKQNLTQKELAGSFITRNMLSQIENDLAKPSISTMAYLAKQLNCSNDYFMNEQSKSSQIAKLAKEFMVEYKEDNCEGLLNRLDKLRIQSPGIFENDFIKEMYINCHFKCGRHAIHQNDNEKALKYYEGLLKYEEEFMIDNELTAYELYTKLVDSYSLSGNLDKAIEYNKKSKNLIRKMMATKEVQNLYLLMTNSNYREVINTAKKIDRKILDDYNRARLNMVLGNAHFNLHYYKTAVDYLELAIGYYEEKTYNSLTILMYEELSKCYSNLEEHEKAVEYMLKAKSNSEKRHQFG